MLHGGMVEKWDPFPGLLGTPQNPWTPESLWDPRDPLQSPGRRRTLWDAENLPGTTLAPPVFLGM